MFKNPFSSHEENDKNKEQSEYKYPDQIIIGDENYQEQSESPYKDHSKEETTEQTQPLSLRLLCFLGLIFCTIYGFGMILLSLITTFFACITLFQNHKLNRNLFRYWKSTFNTFVAGFGFVLGLLIPPLGLGFLILYFSLVGENMDTDILTKIIKKSFQI